MGCILISGLIQLKSFKKKRISSFLLYSRNKRNVWRILETVGLLQGDRMRQREGKRQLMPDYCDLGTETLIILDCGNRESSQPLGEANNKKTIGS